MAFRPTKTRSPVAGGIRPRTTRLSAVARNRHPAAVAAGWNSASPIARTAFLMGDRRNPDRLVKLDVVDRTRKAPEPMFPSPMSPPTHGSASSGHLNTRRGQGIYLAQKNKYLSVVNVQPRIISRKNRANSLCRSIVSLVEASISCVDSQLVLCFSAATEATGLPGLDRFKSNAGRLTAERDLEPGEIAARLDRATPSESEAYRDTHGQATAHFPRERDS